MASPGNLLSVSGPLTSSGATPLLSLAGGDVRARNLGVVSSAAGVLTLGGAFLDRSGAGNTLLTTDDLLNVSAGGRLVAAGADPLLRFTDTTVTTGNATGDQLFQLTGAGSSATLSAGLLGASNTAFSLTGSSLVDVSTGAVLTATGAGPLAALSGGSLALGTATGFAISSTGASQIGGSLLRTTNTGVTTTGDLVSVSGTLTGTGTAPLLDLDGGAVAARNGVLVSTTNGRLSLNGPALARTGGTLATTDDLFNISGGARLTSAGTGALLGLLGRHRQCRQRQRRPALRGDRGRIGGDTGRPAARRLRDHLHADRLVLRRGLDRGDAHRLGAAPLTALSGGALNLGAATGFLVSSTSPSTVGGSLLRTTGADVATTGNLVTVSGSLTDTGTAALLDLAGGAVAARNGLALSSAAGQLSLNGPALGRTGGTLTVTDDLFNISAGARLTSTGAGALLGFSGATVNIGNGTGDQLFQLTGAGSSATLAGGLLEASNTAFTLTGSSLMEVSTAAVLTANGAGPLAAASGGSLALGNATGFVISSTGASQIAGSLLRTTNTGLTTTGDLVSVSGTLSGTGTTPLLDLDGGAVAARSGILVSTANGRLSLNGPALTRTGGTLTLTDDLVGITAGGRLTDAGAGPLLAFSGRHGEHRQRGRRPALRGERRGVAGHAGRPGAERRGHRALAHRDRAGGGVDQRDADRRVGRAARQPLGRHAHARLGGQRVPGEHLGHREPRGRASRRQRHRHHRGGRLRAGAGRRAPRGDRLERAAALAHRRHPPVRRDRQHLPPLRHRHRRRSAQRARCWVPRSRSRPPAPCSSRSAPPRPPSGRCAWTWPCSRPARRC